MAECHRYACDTRSH